MTPEPLTEIEVMLAELKSWGRPYLDDDLPEGPRSETWAADADAQRAAFTCRYCGGHSLLECYPAACSVFRIEIASSSAAGDRSEEA